MPGTADAHLRSTLYIYRVPENPKHLLSFPLG